jgi:hypothetical protein
MSRNRRGLSERDLREQIRNLCKVLGWRLAFTQYSLRSPKGFPDLILLRPPRIIFAELKSETGKTTPEQDAWLDGLRGLPSAEVFLWRPVDIERIADVLR